MIVYGSRMYFRSNIVKHFGICDHCGNYTKQQSYRGQKFGHLYFIPILPMGSKSQVLDECSQCEMGSHLPLEQAGPAIEKMQMEFKQWIEAVQEGETEVTPEGSDQPINVGFLIAESASSLFRLNQLSRVDDICAILDAEEMDFEKEMVLAKWCELTGDAVQRSRHFQTASRLRPDDLFIAFETACALRLGGRTEEAIGEFRRLISMDPSELTGYVQLAGIYEVQKDFQNLAVTLEAIFEIDPELRNDRKTKKLYKKACKKSGHDGKFLNP